MARLYVGCLVRIARDFDGLSQPPVGSEGIISDALGWYEVGPEEGDEQMFGFEVDVGGDFFICRPEELEPIVPEGRQVVGWSECLWQPQGEVA